MNPDDKGEIDPALRKIMEIPDDQELPDDALIEVMLRALESHQLLIRSSAVHQLVDVGKRNPTMAIPKILNALDPSVDYWTVRFGAVEALGEIANKNTLQPLVKYLKEDEDPDFRAMVAKQLGEMGDVARDAGTALIEVLADRDNSEIRENAAHALGILSFDQAVPSLIKALELEKDNYAKREICWALGEIGNSSALPSLLPVLTDKDKESRAKAVEALGKIENADSIIPILNTTKDKDTGVQAKAIEALKNFSTENIMAEFSKIAEADLFIALQHFQDYLFNIENEEVTKKVLEIKEPILNAYKEKMNKIKSNLESCKVFVEENFETIANQSKKDLKELLEKKIPKIEAKVANVSLYEFRKQKWLENDLYFEIDEISKLYKESGVMLSELRDSVQDLLKKGFLPSIRGND
ncbi:MAG: HEAT repeat domain-containing protein [Candidatus Hodarchaeales archaeon]|jgi:HEAT repeat protein